MQPLYAIVAVEVYCSWTQQPPRYRVFVNDELFAERTFIWDGGYFLDEHLTISGPIGKYQIRCENVDPDLGEFKFKNMRLVDGHGMMHKNTLDLY